MGWTAYHASHYTKGKPDRVAEVNDLLTWSDERIEFSVILSKAVGSTVYSAVKQTDKATGKESVIGVVTLTSIDTSSDFNFSYKEIEESCGPSESKCPQAILDLLSPVETIYGGRAQEWAAEWRERCAEYNAARKTERANPDSLSNLPVGSQICWKYRDSEGEKEMELVKVDHPSRKRPIWMCGTRTYVPVTRIKTYSVIRA